MKKTILILPLLILFYYGCNDDETPNIDMDIVENLSVIVNPSGVAPLTAQLLIQTSVDASVEITIQGKNGANSNVTHHFSNVGKTHDLMVLGLYADYDNPIHLAFFNENSVKIDEETFSIQTDPLISALPQIEINTVNESQMTPGMHFVNYLGHNGVPFPPRPFMFDNFGDIRWYLDFSSNEILDYSFSDVGMFRLQNGNLIFGDRFFPAIYEVDMYGVIQNTWNLTGYSFHHTVIEKPDGNLLVTVNDDAKTTEEDIILELDRNSGQIVRLWDLTISLDPTRKVWDTNLADITKDWFHANALFWDEADNTLIVSGRTQGVVKLTTDNEVVWILAPHKGWNTAGNGNDLNQYLLQPLDAQGNPIQDQLVLEGDINHPDFEWNWYQHGPTKLPNGNLLLFDNGDNRNYLGLPTYSRAVEFKIDETNKTVQQVWQYGKERGEETYSRVVSKVQYFSNENNVLFTPDAVLYNGVHYGKVLEINKTTNTLVFEATVTPPVSLGINTFHNAVREQLYVE